ncbi:NADPH-cytochrome P450 reductase [Dinochytrium kinnereticum]|nr:NADPH-cytochrome P450 reductase [Dinochytrium kinnereticum]
MSVVDSTDIAILLVVAAATGAFLYWRSTNVTDQRSAGAVGAASARSSSSPNLPLPSTKKSGKKSIIERLNEVENPNKLVLFYGSQTGTAEDLASRVAKEAATNFGLHTLVCDLEEYDMSEMTRWPSPKWLTGFFMATYGEGEPTDNAIEFYEWVMDGKGKGDDEEVDGEDDEMVEEKVCKGLPFFVFGLGNKTYEHFNAISRRLDRRLMALGGKRVGETGEGDDDGSLEDDFLAWKPKLFDALAQFYGIVATSGRENPHNPMFIVDFLDGVEDAKIFHGEVSSDGKPRRWKVNDAVETAKEGGAKFLEITTKKRQAYSVKHPYLSRVAHSRHLFKSTHDVFPVDPSVTIPPSNSYTVTSSSITLERHCVHMEFDLEGSGMRYEAGDHVAILASNSEVEVRALVEVLRKVIVEKVGDLAGCVIGLKPNKEGNPMASSAKIPFSTPSSVGTVLRHYLAITAPMKQHQLEILGKYATDEDEKRMLFGLVDDRDLFIKNIETPQKNLREVLEAFPSIKIPLSVILGEVLGHIQPRFYSISSSAKKDPTRVSVTAVVVRYVLPSPDPVDRPRKAPQIVYKEGLATSMIHRLHDLSMSRAAADGESKGLPLLHVPIFIRTSSFRLPRDPSLPVIMVGPGTGVAPFRGFVAERMVLAEGSGAAGKKAVGPTWLFFGCRHPEQDHLYREEFLEMQGRCNEWRAAGDARAFDLRFLNAFSRAGPSMKKVYVQHRLKEMGDEVWEMLNAKRGDAKHMAADVHTALINIAIEHGGKSEVAAKAWVKNLRTGGRYQEDLLTATSRVSSDPVVCAPVPSPAIPSPEAVRIHSFILKRSVKFILASALMLLPTSTLLPLLVSSTCILLLLSPKVSAFGQNCPLDASDQLIRSLRRLPPLPQVAQHPNPHLYLQASDQPSPRVVSSLEEGDADGGGDEDLQNAGEYDRQSSRRRKKKKKKKKQPACPPGSSSPECTDDGDTSPLPTLPIVDPIPSPPHPDDKEDERQRKLEHLESISDLRVAFLGDHGLTDATGRVMRMVRRWALHGDFEKGVRESDEGYLKSTPPGLRRGKGGKHLALFSGDFDYRDDPEAFFRVMEKSLNGIDTKDGDVEPCSESSLNDEPVMTKKVRHGGMNIPAMLAANASSLDQDMKNRMRRRKKKKSCLSKKGEAFPVFGVVGNHDIVKWYSPGGYRDRFSGWLRRMPDADCYGEYGVNMIFILSGVGTLGTSHADFIHQTLHHYAHVPFRICIWHKNQRNYQTGDKQDETGYEVYETCRRHGAWVVTAHEHSYERSFEMLDFERGVIAPGVVREDVSVKPGRSFAVVSGLGGDSIRRWNGGLERMPWWAATAAADNNATYGALFCTFNPSGKIGHAACFFRDLNGKIHDKFKVDTTQNYLSSPGQAFPTSPPPTRPRFVEIPVSDPLDIVSFSLGGGVGGEVRVGCGEGFLPVGVREGGERYVHALRFRVPDLEAGRRRVRHAFLQVLGGVPGAGTVLGMRISRFTSSDVSFVSDVAGLCHDATASFAAVSLPRVSAVVRRLIDGTAHGEVERVEWTPGREAFEDGEVWVGPDLGDLMDGVVGAEEREVVLWVEGWTRGEGGFWGVHGELGMCVSPTLVLVVE